MQNTSFSDIFIDKSVIYSNTFNEYMNLLCSCLQFKNLPSNDIPHEFLFKILFEEGKIGYYKNMFFRVSYASGSRDIYGRMANVRLTADNGTHFLEKRENVAILRANPQAYPMISIISSMASEFTLSKVAMLQNIVASQNPQIIEVDSKDEKYTIETALLQKSEGKPAILVRKGLSGTLAVKPTASDFMADKYQQLCKELRDEFLTKIGILTANTNKRERVQTAEVNATIGEAIDSIYMIIDTFNDDAIRFNVDVRLELNASIERLYAGDEEIEESEV